VGECKGEKKKRDTCHKVAGLARALTETQMAILLLHQDYKNQIKSELLPVELEYEVENVIIVRIE